MGAYRDVSVSLDPASHPGGRGVPLLPVLWCTVAFNLAALWLAVVAVALLDVDLGSWLPLASLALSVGVGLVAVCRARTRRLGIGCLAGAAVGVGIFLVLSVVCFLTYFVMGGNQLS